MRAALLATLLLALAAPVAGAQDAIDRAVEALSADPVYVDPAADDAPTAAEADELRARIAEGDAGDVYVAVLPASAGSGADVARAIADRGREGSYAVFVGDELWTGGTPETAEARAEALDEGDKPAALLTFVDGLAEARDDGGGGAGGLILLGLAGAGGTAVLVGRRRKRRREAEAFAEVKENARDDLVALGDDIRALDLDMEMPGASAEARDDYATAVGAYDRANTRWNVARKPDDLEPVGAALEEGRWAMTAAKARIEGRTPPERRSPCFFDPRHGPSDREVEWAPPYGEPRMVPACEMDARRVEGGEEPQTRQVLVGGRRVPYWDAGPMYAPFAGGFYGSGLLPGLMIGTMMGDSMGWGGHADGGGGDFGGFGGGDVGGGDFGGFGGGDFGG